MTTEWQSCIRRAQTFEGFARNYRERAMKAQEAGKLRGAREFARLARDAARKAAEWRKEAKKYRSPLPTPEKEPDRE